MSPARIDPGQPGAAPVGGRQQTSRALLVYTAGRIVAFLVSLAFLRLLGFHTYALLLGALLLSGLASLVLFRRQRAAVSQALVARPKRDALSRRPPSRRRTTTAAADNEVDADSAFDPYADDEDDLPGDGSPPEPRR